MSTDKQERRKLRRFHEGWLFHKGRQVLAHCVPRDIYDMISRVGFIFKKSLTKNDSSWKKYWVVLKEDVMFFFNSSDTANEKDCRCLTIDVTSKYMKPKYKDKDKTYHFELKTAGGLENRFKCNKFIEREVWKAYVIGISTNQVSDDLDLLPGQIQKVYDDIQYFHSRTRDSFKPPREHRKHDSISEDFESPHGSIASKESTPEFFNGGPTIVHKFYNDSSRKDIPSWFFANIGRISAEQILTQGYRYGNTLMRESARSSGSYSITKLVDRYGTVKFDHFEVIRTAEHFKINVDNQHAPCKCLEDIMGTFLDLSGVEVTRPMTSNNLKELGFSDPDYRTAISGKWRDADSGEEEESVYIPPSEPSQSPNAESEDTYEVPNSQTNAPSGAMRKPTSGGPQGLSKTLTPGTNEKFLEELSKNVVAKQYKATVTGLPMQKKSGTKAQISELVFVEKDPTQALDDVINDFEDNEEYVNENELEKTRNRSMSEWNFDPEKMPQETPLPRGGYQKRSKSLADISLAPLNNNKIAGSWLSKMVTVPDRVPGLVKMAPPPTTHPIVGAPVKSPPSQQHSLTRDVGRSNESMFEYGNNLLQPKVQDTGHVGAPRSVPQRKAPAPPLKHSQSMTQINTDANFVSPLIGSKYPSKSSVTQLETTRRPRQCSIDETSGEYYNYGAKEPSPSAISEIKTGNMYRVITVHNVKDAPLPSIPGTTPSTAPSSPPVDGAVKKTPPAVKVKPRMTNENTPSNAVPQSPSDTQERPKSVHERLAMFEKPDSGKGEVGNGKFQQSKNQQRQHPNSVDDEYYNDVIQFAPPPACDSQGLQGYVNCPPPKTGVNTGQVNYQGNAANFKYKLSNIIMSQATSPKMPGAPTKFPPEDYRDDEIYTNIPYDDIK